MVGTGVCLEPFSESSGEMEPKIGCGKGHSAAKRFQLETPGDDIVDAGDENDDEEVGRRNGEDDGKKSQREIG